MSTYWDKLLEIWTANRIVGCQCEFCHGTDICTIQQCWNTFYGGAKHPTNGSSANYVSAKVQSVEGAGLRTYGPMHCVGCNEKNDYAEPNRPDGTYICFQCRS